MMAMPRMDRTAESEWQDNAWRIALRGYAEALARIGLHPRFIIEDQLASGTQRVSALILPHSVALSDEAIRTIAAFAAKGGQVIADTPPGQFDRHGRRRIAPDVPAAIVSPENLPTVLSWPAAVQVTPTNVEVETYLFRSHGRRLLALQQRNPGSVPESVTVELHGRQPCGHGRQQRLTLTLDPITPTILESDRKRYHCIDLHVLSPLLSMHK